MVTALSSWRGLAESTHPECVPFTSVWVEAKAAESEASAGELAIELGERCAAHIRDISCRYLCEDSLGALQELIGAAQNVEFSTLGVDPKTVHSFQVRDVRIVIESNRRNLRRRIRGCTAAFYRFEQRACARNLWDVKEGGLTLRAVADRGHDTPDSRLVPIPVDKPLELLLEWFITNQLARGIACKQASDLVAAPGSDDHDAGHVSRVDVEIFVQSLLDQALDIIPRVIELGALDPEHPNGKPPHFRTQRQDVQR